jgi:hypothetical protein
MEDSEEESEHEQLDLLQQALAQQLRDQQQQGQQQDVEERMAALQQLLQLAGQLQQQQAEEVDVDAWEDTEPEEDWCEAEGSDDPAEEQGGEEQEDEEYEHPSQIPRFKDASSWYKRNASKQLYPSARITVIKAIFMLMAWKADFNVTDAAFGAMLGMLTELLLPQVCRGIGLNLPCSIMLHVSEQEAAANLGASCVLERVAAGCVAFQHYATCHNERLLPPGCHSSSSPLSLISPLP